MASTTTASTAPAAIARSTMRLVVDAAAVLADVDGEGDDLDAVVLDHPADGDGRVESAGVREHDSLGHLGLAPHEAGEVGELGGDLGAADALGGDDDQGVVAGDGAEDVGQRGPVEGGADDVGRAGRRAQDDEVGRVGDLDDPLAQHPPQVVLGRPLLLRELGDGVDELAAAGPHLDGAEVLEVARDGRLGGDDAVGGEELDELRLARRRACWARAAGDAVLALVLGQSAAPRRPSSPVDLGEPPGEAAERRAGGCGPGG